MNHWYNCWLFHTWGQWSEPTPGEATRYDYVSNETTVRDVQVQIRTCSLCNLIKVRKAA